LTRGVCVGAIVVVIVACHGEPPAQLPTTETPPAALDDIARACARITSCADAHDPTHLRSASSCVDWWLVSTTIESDTIACLSKATTCKAIEACTHDPQDENAIQFCVAHPGVLGTCDGTRLYNCSDDPSESSATDCSTLGGTCVEQRISGGLVVRGCQANKLCPQNAPVLRCEANAIVRCEDGIAERRDCPRTTHCIPGGDEGASCEGEPAKDRPQRCSKPGLASCEGDRVTFCALVGRNAWLRTADCATWGLTCAMRDARANCTVRNGTCNAEAHCDGDALVFCAAGAEMRVSCKDLGLTRCDPAAHGQEAGCR
jgi:hypothetical protein